MLDCFVISFLAKTWALLERKGGRMPPLQDSFATAFLAITQSVVEVLIEKWNWN